MAMRMGLLGKKLGMTQVFSEDGERIPVTVIQAGPCHVVGKRTVDKDGYSALMLGFDTKPERTASRPELGMYKRVGLAPQRVVREFRLPPEDVEKYEIGQAVRPAEIFEGNSPVDVSGLSKGRGFSGVMKKHNFGGGKASHGVHEYYRHGGSIGCRLTPGRVFKGKKMSGQLGMEKKTVQNLQLVQVLEDDDCVLVRGSVPGANGSYVTVKKATTRTIYKRVGMGQEESRSKNPLKASKKAAGGR